MLCTRLADDDVVEMELCTDVDDGRDDRVG